MDPKASRLLALGLTAALTSLLAAAPAAGSATQPLSQLMARQVAAVAKKPADVPLLIATGRTALKIGDAHAAAGFFGRARELAPDNAAAHLGMASTLVALNRPDAAFAEFARARDLGTSPGAFAADLGLAYDLAGDQAKAQAVYRSALGGPSGAEARRRLALSLAISGDPTGADAMLQPLITAGDAAALRNRAFVLALAGDVVGSTAALNQLAPGKGSAAEPFLRALAALSAGEKAAALNLGIFPSAVPIAATDQDVEGAFVDVFPGVPRPMEYGGHLKPGRAMTPDEQRKASLSLYGVFAEP